MVNSAGKRWGITVNENGLEIIKALFEQYNISLEEKDYSPVSETLPESDDPAVTDPLFNNDSVTIGEVSFSLSESRQDILVKLETTGFDYGEVQSNRLINLQSASDWNAQTARGLHPGYTDSQMMDLYGKPHETHAYSDKGIYTIYRYFIGACICEFGIAGENSDSIYNIDIYLPSQFPIYKYGEEIKENT